MKNILILTLLCSGCYISLHAQDPSFSQYESNPLYYNPAYAGDAADLRVGINYRNMWPNVPGAIFPGPLSTYDIYLDKQFNSALVGGIGVFLMQNVKGEGLYRTTSAGGIYSWHMPTKTRNFNMYFGTKVYFNNIHLDYSRLVFSDQVSDTSYLNTSTKFNPQNNGSKNYIDFDAGFVVKANFRPKWSNEFSFSASHLIRPNISMNGLSTKLPLKFVASYSSSFPIMKDKLFLSPKILFEYQDVFMAFTPGVIMYITNKRYNPRNLHTYTKPLYFGFFYHNGSYSEGKNTNSFIAMIGHTGSLGNNGTRYQVGASYDFPMGGLSISTYGAVEISATIILHTKNALRAQGKCVRFEGNPLGPIN